MMGSHFLHSGTFPLVMDFGNLVLAVSVTLPDGQMLQVLLKLFKVQN